MYSFSIIAIAKYSKLKDLNNTNVIFYWLGGQKSKVGLIGCKSRHLTGLVPSESSRVEPIFQLLEVATWLPGSWSSPPSSVAG